ncbi:hypothetical protein BJ742DRAFT_910036 [Cladochytrium replicatum]|nr:hypothetical protein BJ742DRAFT_910036 [Cladochytrium replicatum]
MTDLDTLTPCQISSFAEPEQLSQEEVANPSSNLRMSNEGKTNQQNQPPSRKNEPPSEQTVQHRRRLPTNHFASKVAIQYRVDVEKHQIPSTIYNAFLEINNGLKDPARFGNFASTYLLRSSSTQKPLLSGYCVSGIVRALRRFVRKVEILPTRAPSGSSTEVPVEVHPQVIFDLPHHVLDFTPAGPSKKHGRDDDAGQAGPPSSSKRTKPTLDQKGASVRTETLAKKSSAALSARTALPAPPAGASQSAPPTQPGLESPSENEKWSDEEEDLPPPTPAWRATSQEDSRVPYTFLIAKVMNPLLPSSSIVRPSTAILIRLANQYLLTPERVRLENQIAGLDKVVLAPDPRLVSMSRPKGPFAPYEIRKWALEHGPVLWAIDLLSTLREANPATWDPPDSIGTTSNRSNVELRAETRLGFHKEMVDLLTRNQFMVPPYLPPGYSVDSIHMELDEAMVRRSAYLTSQYPRIIQGVRAYRFAERLLMVDSFITYFRLSKRLCADKGVSIENPPSQRLTNPRYTERLHAGEFSFPGVLHDAGFFKSVFCNVRASGGGRVNGLVSVFRKSLLQRIAHVKGRRARRGEMKVFPLTNTVHSRHGLLIKPSLNKEYLIAGRRLTALLRILGPGVLAMDLSSVSISDSVIYKSDDSLERMLQALETITRDSQLSMADLYPALSPEIVLRHLFTYTYSVLDFVFHVGPDDYPAVGTIDFQVDGMAGLDQVIPVELLNILTQGVLTDRDMSMCLLRSDGTEEIDTSTPFTKSIDRLDLHDVIDLVSTFPLPQTPRGESPPSLEQSPSL